VSRRRPVASADDETDPEEAPANPPKPAGPSWIQPQTVRLVVSGLTMVYLVGLLSDLRAYPVPFASELAVLVVVVVIVALTSRWWDPKFLPLPKPRARVFLALGGLAVLVQVVGVVVQSGYANDLAGNAPALLLVIVLFLNCLT
jgi:hypothetical protein